MARRHRGRRQLRGLLRYESIIMAARRCTVPHDAHVRSSQGWAGYPRAKPHVGVAGKYPSHRAMPGNRGDKGAAHAELTCARRGCRVWRSDRYRCCCAYAAARMMLRSVGTVRIFNDARSLLGSAMSSPAIGCSWPTTMSWRRRAAGRTRRPASLMRYGA